MSAGGPATPGALPTIHVDGGMELALARRALATLDGEPLARFLAARRWFGGKGRSLGRARVVDVVPLDLAAPAALAVVEVGAAGAGPGDVARYQLPLVVRRVGTDNGAGGPVAVLARVESAGGSALLFDATEDVAFRRALGAAVERGASFSSAEGARWRAEPVGEGVHEGPTADAESRLIASEQSNTSIIYDDRAILKLFRRVEPGEHPDVAARS